MKARRLRPTNLLRAVIFAWCVALAASVFLLGMQSGWVLGSLTFVVLLWFVGIENGLLLYALERFLARRAAANGARGHSIWFIDEDQEADEQAERFRDETSDNPTIR